MILGTTTTSTAVVRGGLSPRGTTTPCTRTTPPTVQGPSAAHICTLDPVGIGGRYPETRTIHATTLRGRGHLSRSPQQQEPEQQQWG